MQLFALLFDSVVFRRWRLLVSYRERHLSAALPLLTAAGFKNQQLSLAPLAGLGTPAGRRLLIAAVEFELALGTPLSFYFWRKNACEVPIVTFRAPSVISLWHGARRPSSCGCFDILRKSSRLETH
jgi:hypothetical protein